LAAAVAATGLFSKDPALSVVAGVATAKVGLSFGQAFTRAVLCNALVVLACWVQAASKDLIGKILSMWFPVMLFVLAGFEHSIANMFFIPLGQFLGAEITFAQTWLGNILPVTLGNFVGGAVIVPCAYYAAYLAGAKAEKAQSPAQKKKK
jgi:formate/nitrite transporter